MRDPKFYLLCLAAAALPGAGVRAQAAPPQSGQKAVDLRALADSVAPTGTTTERTRTLVRWVNDNFRWSATDYQKRTPEQIVAQRSGNCAELASVLRAFLDASGVRSRWVREINVQPGPSARRQRTAAEMVAQKGNRYSVFGLQHNDHVWLEVFDGAADAWFPADPAYGVVGLDEWLPARLALANRPRPRVPAVIPIAADMLVPFVVESGESRSGPYTEDRTVYYLIDGLDRLYGGRLHALPAWENWAASVRAVSPHARDAFNGLDNLHRYNGEIVQLKATYDELVREAAARGVAIAR